MASISCVSIELLGERIGCTSRCFQTAVGSTVGYHDIAYPIIAIHRWLSRDTLAFESFATITNTLIDRAHRLHSSTLTRIPEHTGCTLRLIRTERLTATGWWTGRGGRRREWGQVWVGMQHWFYPDAETLIIIMSVCPVRVATCPPCLDKYGGSIALKCGRGQSVKGNEKGSAVWPPSVERLT